MSTLEGIIRMIKKEYEESKILVPLVLSNMPEPIREDVGIKLMMRGKFLAQAIIDFLKITYDVDIIMDNEDFSEYLFNIVDNVEDTKLVYELDTFVRLCRDNYYHNKLAISIDYQDGKFEGMTYEVIAKYLRFLEFKIQNVMKRMEEWEGKCKE